MTKRIIYIVIFFSCMALAVGGYAANPKISDVPKQEFTVVNEKASARLALRAIREDQRLICQVFLLENTDTIWIYGANLQLADGTLLQPKQMVSLDKPSKPSKPKIRIGFGFGVSHGERHETSPHETGTCEGEGPSHGSSHGGASVGVVIPVWSSIGKSSEAESPRSVEFSYELPESLSSSDSSEFIVYLGYTPEEKEEEREGEIGTEPIAADDSHMAHIFVFAIYRDGGVVVKDYAAEEEEPALGIYLHRDDDKWIPHFNQTTTMTATIHRWNPTTRDWEYPGAPRIITVQFAECSNEKGVCMNHLHTEAPDLYFTQKHNPQLNVDDDKTGRGHFHTARTRKAVTKQTVVVLCDDYGAFSKLEATAPGCVPLKRLPNGKLAKATPKEARRKLPKDDNDNYIADEFELQRGHHPLASEDNENDPVGNGTKGDGLTAYEEYRGFKVNLTHTRTSWVKKDLFIYDRDFMGFSIFPEASRFTCHSVWYYELDKNRIVNYNRDKEDFDKGRTLFSDKEEGQHGLLLVNKPLPEGKLGRSRGGFGPPKNVKEIVIDKSKFFDAAIITSSNDKGESSQMKWRKYLLDWVIAHELGHGTGAHHHSETPEPDWRREMIYPPGTKGVPTNRIHTKKTLDDIFDLPARFRVGRKHNKRSGDMNCIMRYPFFLGTYYRNSNGFERCNDYDFKQTNFCESPIGTGPNANRECASDAERGLGNCKAQLVVCDKEKEKR